MRVLICGGGVIGASLAYFLSKRGVRALVIERAALASAASGKSGGFLALDWCDGTPLQQLARRSFALHGCLPEEIGSEWGYRRLDTYSGCVEVQTTSRPRQGSGRHWLADHVTLDRRLGTTSTTAQVHPGRFTIAMMQAAEAHGAEFHVGRVSGLALNKNNTRVEGVEVDGAVISGDAVVIAMGPWSSLAARWLPAPLRGRPRMGTGPAQPPVLIPHGRQNPPLEYPGPTRTPSETPNTQVTGKVGLCSLVRLSASSWTGAWSEPAPLLFMHLTARSNPTRSAWHEWKRWTASASG